MSDNSSPIIYTHTDEAPALATYSLLPIIQAFAGAAGVSMDTRDISLAARILAVFPDALSEEQRTNDALAELGEMVLQADANIIKLPNVSASMPQLRAAIAELQANGFPLPEYRADPQTAEDEEINARYDSVRGSAVNPVLREGNSDRRAPKPVKAYARANPHSMGEWSSASKSHVATMDGHDFKANEQSLTMTSDDVLRIELVTDDGVTVLKEAVPVLDGEIVDGTFMSASHLDAFLAEQIDDAREQGILFSLHLKATMMKISDPIMFGHAVRAYFANVFAKHHAALSEVDADANNGFGNVLNAIAALPDATRQAIEADIAAAYAAGPDIAMVNSDKGITNLHVPSDVIVDASMPAMIRSSGQMWNKDGQLQDVKAVIPDSSYAGVYQATIDDCIAHGAYNPVTMGSVSNVGLMAQKAEEYGSHPKTFEIPTSGMLRVVNQAGETILSFDVHPGDIWRMCNARDLPIQDWVKLAVTRARATNLPAIFWLDPARGHDRQMMAKVEQYLGDHDTDGLEIAIMSPVEATLFSLARIREGLDTISVTGNVLRDYNTDLFPILEVGTSAKMLSIVPLMNGGGLFETGAGGSAPKHVQQFEEENYLRWDSLGEFLALAVSFDHFAEVNNNIMARILGETLDIATSTLLEENKSPARRLGKIDNRGSHFYLALYWAEALAAQTNEVDLAAKFAPLAAALRENETVINDELIAVQGRPNDLGGYYLPKPELVEAAMRPSTTFNNLIDNFS